MRMRRFLSMLLAISMVFSMLPMSVFATEGDTPVDEEIIAPGEEINANLNGDLSDTVSWEYSSQTGTLTITGEGSIPDFAADADRPWHEIATEVTTVVVSEGITSVGNYAFYDFAQLSDLQLAATVTRLGDYALGNCGLGALILPLSVVEFGKQVVEGSKNLNRLLFLGSVENLGEFDVDDDNELLISLEGCFVIPDVYGEEEIPCYVCTNCGKILLTDGTILDDGGTIQFTDMILDTPVEATTVVGQPVCFRFGIDDESLANVCEYRFTFRSEESFYIEVYNFMSDCIDWAETKSYESTFYVWPYEDFCFYVYGVDGKGDVSFTAEASHAVSPFVNTEIITPKTCTTDGLGHYNCNNCGHDWNAVIPAGHEFINGYCQNCTETQNASGTLGTLEWNLDMTRYDQGPDGEAVYNPTLTITGQGSLEAGKEPFPWANLSENIRTVVLGEGITTIGENAFSRFTNLQSINIPSTVTSIGDYAFEYTYSLETLELPEGLTELGTAPFSMSAIRQLTIPASVSSIGDAFFYNAMSLESVIIAPENQHYKMVGNGLYTADGERLLSVLKRPYSVESPEVTTFDVPDGVEVIGVGAFASVFGITDITLPDTLTTISDSAFAECFSLEEIAMPSSLRHVGANAFTGCSVLTQVTFTGDLETLGECAFAGCESLKSVTFQQVKDIGPFIFDGVIPETVTFLGDAPENIHPSAFRFCETTIFYPGDNETWTEDVLTAIQGSATVYPIGTVIILGQTEDMTLPLGGSTILEVNISGENISFQWQEEIDGKWVDLEGMNESSMPLTVEKDMAYFRCQITAENGTCQYSDTITITGMATLALNTPTELTATYQADPIQIMIIPNTSCEYYLDIAEPYNMSFQLYNVAQGSYFNGNIIGNTNYCLGWLIAGQPYILTLSVDGINDPYTPSPDFGSECALTLKLHHNHIINVFYPDVQPNCHTPYEGSFTCECGYEWTETVQPHHEFFHDPVSMQSICQYCRGIYCGMNAAYHLDPETGLLTITGSGSIHYNWDRGSIREVSISDGITNIPEHAFHYEYGLNSMYLPASIAFVEAYAFSESSISALVFSGHAPQIHELAFEGTTMTVYYPANDSSWTEDMMWGYGGNVTWMPYSGDYIFPSVCSDTPQTTLTIPVMDFSGKTLVDYSWSSSDDQIVAITNSSAAAAELELKTVGVATVTLILNYEDGTSETLQCQVTVTDYPVLPLNDPIFVTTKQNAFIYYSFTPDVSCIYHFNNDHSHAYGVLYDEEGTVLIAAEGFSFSYALEAGKTYLLGVRSYDWSGGNQLRIELEHWGSHESRNYSSTVINDPVCTPENEFVDGLAYCVCHACDATWYETLEADHNFDSNGICRYCGYEFVQTGELHYTIQWSYHQPSKTMRIFLVDRPEEIDPMTDMPDYTDSPWSYFADNGRSIETVIVEEGITSIGDGLLNGIHSLKNVQLPSTLTRIGESAFNNCSSLKNLTLNSGLRSIDSYAFSGTGLSHLIIPASVTELGNQIFRFSQIRSVIFLGDAPEFWGTPLDTSNYPLTAYYSGDSWTGQIFNDMAGEGTVIWSKPSEFILVDQSQMVETVASHPVTFYVTVYGNAGSFQWQESSDADWVDIPGANDSALHLTASDETASKRYRCIISSSDGSLTVVSTEMSLQLAFSLQLGMDNTLLMDYSTGRCQTLFAPQQTGLYTFQLLNTYNSYEASVDLLDADGTLLDRNHNSWYLTAGQIYTVDISQVYQSSVTIRPLFEEEVSENELIEYEIPASQNTCIFTFTPAQDGFYRLSFFNFENLSFKEYPYTDCDTFNYDMGLHELKGGTKYVFYLTSYYGESASGQFSIDRVSNLLPGTELTLQPGEEKTFLFTPEETGYYAFARNENIYLRFHSAVTCYDSFFQNLYWLEMGKTYQLSYQNNSYESQSFTATVTRPEAIMLNEAVPFYLENSSNIAFTYVPEVSDWYYFTQTPDIGSFYVYRQEEGIQSFVHNRNDCKMNSMYLEEGIPYLLILHSYSYDPISGTALLQLCPEPTYLDIEGDDSIFVGDVQSYSLRINPGYAAVDYTVSFSDPSVATLVDTSGKNFTIKALKSGTTTLTVTMANGLSDTIELTVHQPVTITEGVEGTYRTTNDYSAKFWFTPETSGIYVFRTNTGNDKFYLELNSEANGHNMPIHSSTLGDSRYSYFRLEAGISYSITLRSSIESQYTYTILASLCTDPEPFMADGSHITVTEGTILDLCAFANYNVDLGYGYVDWELTTVDGSEVFPENWISDYGPYWMFAKLYLNTAQDLILTLDYTDVLGDTLTYYISIQEPTVSESWDGLQQEIALQPYSSVGFSLSAEAEDAGWYSVADLPENVTLTINRNGVRVESAKRVSENGTVLYFFRVDEYTQYDLLLTNNSSDPTNATVQVQKCSTPESVTFEVIQTEVKHEYVEDPYYCDCMVTYTTVQANFEPFGSFASLDVYLWDGNSIILNYSNEDLGQFSYSFIEEGNGYGVIHATWMGQDDVHTAEYVYNQPYLTYRNLSMDNEGYYFLSGSSSFADTIHLDYSSAEERPMIFFLNSYNAEEHAMQATPVEVSVSGDFCLMNFSETDKASMIAPGEEYSDYFYFLSANGWEKSGSIQLGDCSLTVESGSLGIGFFSEPILSRDFICANREITVSAENPVFYIGFLQGERIMQDVCNSYIQDDILYTMSGYGNVMIEPVEGNSQMWKVTVLDHAIDQANTMYLEFHAQVFNGYNTNAEHCYITCKIEVDESEYVQIFDAEGKLVSSHYTLEAALAKAAPGQTVRLNADMSAGTIILPAAVTLDLSSHYLTTNIFLSFGNVIDSHDPAVSAGGLVISNDTTKAMVQLLPTNTYLPIYDTDNGCYRFYECTLVSKGIKSNGSIVQFHYRLEFTDSEAYYVLRDSEDTGLELYADIQWTGMNMPVHFEFVPDLIEQFAESMCSKLENGEKLTATLYVQVSGLSRLTSGNTITAAPQLDSKTSYLQDGITLIHTVP